MSYSLNDNFYIDTETSTARLQGNLDLQNSIRFNKTDTEEGIVIQANIIKERLVEASYIPNEIGTQFNTRIINNVINSNNLQIQIIDTFMNVDNTQVILKLQNTDINNTYILPLLGNNYISIPPSHQLCYKLDTTFHTFQPSTSYLPYIGTTYEHRTYFQYNNFDYFIGYAYGSNTFLRETTNQQLFIEGPTGYFTKRTPQNTVEHSIYLKGTSSYFTDAILQSSNEVIVSIYKNLNNVSLKWIDIQQNPVYDSQITVPITQNDYYILLFSHLQNNPSQYSFIKYIRTLGNITVPHLPRLLSTTTGFLCYFLTQTNPLTPITIYSLKYMNGSYSYIQDPNISIPGTSFADTYQYVLIYFNSSGVYEWHIRIVMKSLNKTIQDPIYVVYHENKDFTVSIINQSITDIIVYNADKSTTFLTNIYNVCIRFNENGNYRWSTKYHTIQTNAPHKSIISAYTSNTFFMNLLYDTTLGNTVNIYNSDGTSFNNFNIEDHSYTNSIIYYDNNGRVKHENRYTYDYSTTSNNLIQSWFNTNKLKETFIYAQQNRSIDLNSFITYTDAFLNTSTSFIYANSIHLNYFNLLTELSGQKQLSFGNNIRVLNFQATDLNIRGNLSLEDDLSLNQLTLSSNLLLGNLSKVGIGTMIPRTSMDIIGDTLINGKVGIGTNLLESRLNVTTVNENPMSINNQVVLYFPKTGFFNNGYQTTGFIASIDSSNDIVEYPAPFGAEYGGNSLYLSSSDYAAFASRDKAFDKNFNNYWMTALSKYDGSTGLPTGSAGSTVVNGNTVNGEWIQLYNTKKLPLNNYSINTFETLAYPLIGSGYGSPVSRPGSWIIAGSLDGSTWTKVEERNNYVIQNGVTCNLTVNSVIPYHYYRMIITKPAPYTGIYYNPSNPTPPNYGSGITIRELYYYLNLAEKSYPEYKFNTVNYRIKANSIYRYGYNDSNQYLPTNILDDTNVGYWRSGSNEYVYSSQGREAIIEMDIANKQPINQYTFYGKNNLTYPTKWILEGFSDPASNWSILDERYLQINEITTLNNSYTLDSTFNGYKFRFKFYRNNSTYPNFLELQRISLDSKNIIPALRINSNNDINFGGNVIYSGVFSFTGDFTTNGSIYSGLYRKTYTPGTYTIQKPLGGYHTMMVQLWGGGGGGGSGTITAEGSSSGSSTLGGYGGGGGGSGSYMEFSLPRHLLEYSTLTLTVGKGGTGATSNVLTSWPDYFLQNTYNNGISGNNGENTILTVTMINNYSASWVAGGGSGGGGGSIFPGGGGTSGTAGSVSGSSIVGIGTYYNGYNGGAGGTSSANSGISGNPTNTTTVGLSASSGGGGSGVTTSGVKGSVMGAYGGYSTKPYTYLSGTSSLRSIPDNVSGDNLISYGYNGFNIDNTHSGGSGGAGGYGVIYEIVQTVYLKTAGNGYHGGVPAGGGGGGGSITLCSTSFFGQNTDENARGGSGGNGGDGMAIITFY